MGSRLLTRIFIVFVLLLLITIIVTDQWVKNSTRNQMYNEVSAVPKRKIGLLLGTSKFVQGHINLYYRYRIEAAYVLYKSGRVEYILVSGDNSKTSYNEPETMRNDLIAMGIPAEKVVMDYAGFRTFDSIVRCGAVFGEDSITIISQAFHNERALFIANHKGINAIGYNAQDVPKNWSWKVAIREKFARVKMLFDLAFNTQPKYYGPKVKIG